MAMTDTPEVDEDLRAELQQGIFEHLRRSGTPLEVEIQKWERMPEHLASLGDKYRGELVLSFRRFRDEGDADTLRDGLERVKAGFDAGAFGDQIRHLSVEAQPPGVFNEGRERVAIVATLYLLT
jgi:hypothetical protein